LFDFRKYAKISFQTEPSEDGTTVEENKVEIGDVLATLATALGIDPETQNVSELGRPIKIAEGKPIRELLVG